VLTDRPIGDGDGVAAFLLVLGDEIVQHRLEGAPTDDFDFGGFRGLWHGTLHDGGHKHGREDCFGWLHGYPSAPPRV
jgi:hypothetical protein